MIKTHWSGIGAFSSRLRVAAGNKVRSEVARAMKQEMEIERREAVKRAPLDTGDLRRSIRVEGPVMQGQAVSYNLVAGGEKVPYARHVHEDMETPRRVGGPKFIESVVNESAPYMARRVARRMALKGIFK